MIARVVLARIFFGGEVVGTLNHNTNGDGNGNNDNMHDKPKEKYILNSRENN